MTSIGLNGGTTVELELARQVDLIRVFQGLITRWFKAQYQPDGMIPLRSMINSKIAEVRAIVVDTGVPRFLTVGPPPIVGGAVIRVDMFDNIFQDLWGRSVIPALTDTLDQAIGVIQGPEYHRAVEARSRGIGSQGRHASAQPAGDAKRVFLVHGHNEGVLAELEGLLRHIGIEPVVLRQQPNQGRTIIEKFETLAEGVGLAIVLLTADDQGRARPKAPARVPGSYKFRPKKSPPLRARARQNVILELGFFLGRLGRDRVCALYESEVEVPSDYTGVLFIPLAGQWKKELLRELRAASIPFDQDKALSVL